MFLLFGNHLNWMYRLLDYVRIIWPIDKKKILLTTTRSSIYLRGNNRLWTPSGWVGRLSLISVGDSAAWWDSSESDFNHGNHSLLGADSADSYSDLAIRVSLQRLFIRWITMIQWIASLFVGYRPVLGWSYPCCEQPGRAEVSVTGKECAAPKVHPSAVSGAV